MSCFQPEENSYMQHTFSQRKQNVNTGTVVFRLSYKILNHHKSQNAKAQKKQKIFQLYGQ
jgi:hypothetical protein